MSGQIDCSGGVGTGGGGNGQPHHQPSVEDAAGLIPGTDQLRATMRERILEYVRSTRSLAEWQLRSPDLVKRLEEILYTKFPIKNDYYNMMKGPVETQMQFAIMTLRVQNQQNPQMSRQATHMNQFSSNGVVGGANGLVDMVNVSRVDQQFVMLRTTMLEKIFDCIGKKQTSAERRKRLPELAKRLEDILYRTFPNKNDYYNMMKGPIEPQLIVSVKILCAQHQQYQQNLQLARQTPSSSISNEDENLDVDGLSELFASLQFASTHNEERG